MTEEEMGTIGQLLKEKFLKKYNLTQSDLARAVDVPKTRINQILQNKRMITADTDLRLCRFFGLEDGYFLKMQIAIDLKKTKKSICSQLSKIAPKGDGADFPFLHHQQAVVKVAVLCGGPSLERGISLNSARSVLDHLSRKQVQVTPYYMDTSRRFFRINHALLYSNTPEDFDFKLENMADPLSEEEFIGELYEKDIVFPVIHGVFGEDGQLQAFLEKNHIPFIGSPSVSCQRSFDKHVASAFLKRYGFLTLETEVLRKNSPNIRQQIDDFFTNNNVTRVVVKPIYGGSSIGVSSASSPEETFQKVEKFFAHSSEDELLLEPFCVGREFTVIVLQNPDGTCVALVPSEIQVNYENGGIFDYRRKYLPTANTFWFCPPRFDDETIALIRSRAEQLFSLFQMRDFARIDGWILDDGRLLFSDFNPISGMEQNSFIFQQGSRIGLSHADLLWNILKNGLIREKIVYEDLQPSDRKGKRLVHVLFGGKTAERQVSLMSGTNVWLKLSRSELFDPQPFFLDRNDTVWKLPYTSALHHTTEEIQENCQTYLASASRMDLFLKDIQERLSYAPKNYRAVSRQPEKYSLEEFIQKSKELQSFVFIALHGGMGENGTLQAMLSKENISFNGSNAQASLLCMDKFMTGKMVERMDNPQVKTVFKKLLSLSEIRNFSDEQLYNFFETSKKDLKTPSFIIKPRSDGCSSGIVHIKNASDLRAFAHFVLRKEAYIPPNTFEGQKNPVEMPPIIEDEWLLEAYVEIDKVKIACDKLLYQKKTGIVELTVGVFEQNRVYTAFFPSLTVAEGDVLSVEEKFQGGTGINITPPCEEIISREDIASIQRNIEKVAQVLGIENYARIDIFYDTNTKIVWVIEANTLPALTPSTVLFHQALAEKAPLTPIAFLEKLICAKQCIPI